MSGVGHSILVRRCHLETNAKPSRGDRGNLSFLTRDHLPVPVYALCCADESSAFSGTPSGNSLLERDDPVLHRHLRAARQVILAANVRGDDHLGHARLQRGELVALQLRGQLRLQDRVGARRAAAQVCVGDGREIEVTTSCPAALSNSSPRWPMFSSSLNFTRPFPSERE